MTRPIPLERAVQITILRWLRLVLPTGSIVASVTNEHAPASSDSGARARFHQARKAAGVVPGIPDLVCIMPGGVTAWIEVKRPDGGVLSEAQQAMHPAMLALGHIVIVATSIETARHGLQAAGIVLREAAGQAVSAPVVRRSRVVSLPADSLPF